MRLLPTQWKTEIYGAFGMAGGMIGTRISALDYSVAYRTAEACGIPLTQSFIERLRFMEKEILARLKTGEEGCTTEKKKSCAAIYGEYLEWTCKNCKEKIGQ